MSELAKLLLMDQTTVTRNLRVLEESGYIHQEPEVTDRRTKRIQVADIGMSKMEEAEELLREYAAWALGRIGGGKAKAVLESRLKREDSSSVMAEIKAALAN